MMKKTRITELFGIQYPIIQAPMNWITGPELVAAVSNAGGLGTLGPNAGYTTPSYDAQEVGERLRTQIRKVRTLTNKPFAVNLPVGGEISNRCVEVAMEEKVPVAIVIYGTPDMYTSRLKSAGITVVHAVSNVEQAVKAQEAGVDAVVAEGYEGGGHLGKNDLTTMVLTPQIVRHIKIPVIAGGGIFDGRGLVAARALGAEAIYMGTRFIATHECDAHPDLKQAVIEAKDTSTVVIGKKVGRTLRLIHNDFSKSYIEKDNEGATADELMKLWAYPSDKVRNPLSRMYYAFVKGDIKDGAPAAGANSGAINQLVGAGELVHSIMEEAEHIVRGLADGESVETNAALRNS